MDKFEKALGKLNKKELRQLKELLSRLQSGSFKNLNIKKLKNRDNIYRARKGNLRVIYEVRNSKIYLIKIDRRNEKTYKDF